MTALVMLIAPTAQPLRAQQVTANADADASGLPLDAAILRALSSHPDLAVWSARILEARGGVVTAETYPFNPVVSATIGPHLESGTTDLGVEIEQELELGGKGGHREDAARAQLSAATARQHRAARVLVARVHLAFVNALQVREELGVARLDRELTQQLLEVTERRLERGAATQLEVNLASAEFGRAEALEHAVAGRYLDARYQLAAILGAVDGEPPVPAGRLEAQLDGVPALPALLADAPAHRADIAALRQDEEASQARTQLAEASAWPNLTLRAFLERQDGTDTIIGGGISVPLPIFQRGRGEAAEQRAATTRTRAERAAVELEARRDTASAHARYEAASASSAGLQERVVGTLEDNLALLARAVEAGKASWSEVLVMRRSFIDARRSLIEAAAARRRAWIELRLAAGLFAIPSTHDLQARQER